MPVVLITGCNSGFGTLTAFHFARHGYHVFATVRSSSAATELEKTASGADVSLDILQLDVTDEQAIINAEHFEKYSSKDIENTYDGLGTLNNSLNSS